jgi:hypothetical protein
MWMLVVLRIDAAVKACGESEYFFLFCCFGFVLVYAGIYDLRINLGVPFR